MELPTTRYENFIAAFAAQAANPDSRLALTFLYADGSSEMLSGGQLANISARVAHALTARGVGSDEVVIVALPFRSALAPAFIGTMASGAVPTVFPYLNVRQAASVYAQRVCALVRESEARAVITTAPLGDLLRGSVGDACHVLTSEQALNGSVDAALPARDFSPDKAAYLQYTSGSTGHQKGLVISHRALMLHLAARAQILDLRPDDVLVNWLPLYHDMGLVNKLLMTLAFGLAGVILSPFHWVREPASLLCAVSEYRGTLCWMPNFAFNHCVRSIREREMEGVELASLRMVCSGGEPVRADSLSAFAERFAPFGLRADALAAGYGMAENVMSAAITPLGRPPRVDWVQLHALQEERRALPAQPHEAGATSVVSCGVPLPGTEIAIVDEEGGNLPERRVGEILVRSPYLMTGYFRRPDLTARALQDGWLHSGDLGYWAGGELFVCGRIKDLIIAGGKNVFPEDIESIANGVAGVYPGRAVAFGVMDRQLGSERAVLVCEVRPELAEAERRRIVRELRARVVQELDIALGDVQLVPRDWVSKTTSGKIARSANRDQYLLEYASRERGE